MRTQGDQLEWRGTSALSIKPPWTKPQLRRFSRELWGLEAGGAGEAGASGEAGLKGRLVEGGKVEGSSGFDRAEYREKMDWSMGSLVEHLTIGHVRQTSNHHEESKGSGLSLAKKRRVPVLH